MARSLISFKLNSLIAVTVDAFLPIQSVCIRF